MAYEPLARGRSRLKTRIVVGGLRITLGARLETDSEKLSVAPLLNPAGDIDSMALLAGQAVGLLNE
jgi:hypothetical protein